MLPLLIAAPARSALNLNVPARPRAEVLGVPVTLAASVPVAGEVAGDLLLR